MFSADLLCPLYVCAVQRRRFPVGASPTRRTLQPEATGAVMEVTKWLKPSVWLDQSNLLFSRSTNVQLVRLGALAERYFHDDPNRGALQ
jgi:hypothetical protein